jgi:hypothetical protein
MKPLDTIFVNYMVPDTLNMKKLLLSILSVFLVTASCDKEKINENFRDDPSIKNIDGKWKVVSYEDYEKASVTVKNDVDSWNGLDVTLTFATDSLYGYCTTNTVFGKYNLAGRYFSITSFRGTKIGQPAWGNMFSDVINQLRSYKINEHQLRLYYDNEGKSVTLNHD